METALVEGFILSIGLIAAIGSQNLYVLRQGVIGRHCLAVTLTCALCDCLLIAIGALGLGSLIAQMGWLRQAAVWGGILFLTYIGLKSWLRILQNKLSFPTVDETTPSSTTLQVILTSCGYSILNPHAVLDTIILIGGIAAGYENSQERLFFTLGAGIASLLWFTTLSYGARLLRAFFLQRRTAVMFEFFSGLMMFWLALNLIFSEWQLRTPMNGRESETVMVDHDVAER